MRPTAWGSDNCPFLDEANKELPPGQIGSIAIRLPMPPGCLPTLWNNDAGYESSYLTRHPGHYLTGDAGYEDEDGYLYIMSRVDDIINVAGHRLSTGAMEEVLAGHPDVAECAVVGVADALKGEIPVGFVVTKAGVNRSDAELAKQLVERVRERIGPVAAFKLAMVVKRLPKTRSGKILRGTMKKIADGTEYGMPATIDDPATLDEIAATLKKAGYPGKASPAVSVAAVRAANLDDPLALPEPVEVGREHALLAPYRRRLELVDVQLGYEDDASDHIPATIGIEIAAFDAVFDPGAGPVQLHEHDVRDAHVGPCDTPNRARTQDGACLASGRDRLRMQPEAIRRNARSP